jgi:hypothetical protein
LEKTLKTPEYTFNKNKIFVGQFYYKISAKLKSGFVAVSKAQNFAYSFLAPAQVIPKHNAIFSNKSLQTSEGRVLMTWQKTNFTIGYELEICTDEKFTKPYLKKNLNENYFILAQPKPGQYWWRVRSFSETLSSPMSPASAFTVLAK